MRWRGVGVVRAVRLRSPLGRRVLFDGSQSPPMRRGHIPRAIRYGRPLRPDFRTSQVSMRGKVGYGLNAGLLLVSVGALLVLWIFGCGEKVPVESSQRADQSRRRDAQMAVAPIRGKAVKWGVSGAPRGDGYIPVVSVIEWCGGGRKPRFSGIEVAEHQRSVVLTARILPTMKQPRACAPLEIILERSVHLEQPLGARVILDGSTSPAQRRWPPKRSG